ncbi:MAG: leucine-rich repeat domain-containing protein [Ruminiclostridium sp.]|nr:leucine-rich repeat domain-containing protein [Ruminiclostridium sp.]
MKRMKKTLAGILAATLVAGSFPILSGGQLDGFTVQAGAEDTRPSGIKGNVTATVDNGVLRVQKVPGTDGRMSEDYTGWAPNGKNSLTEAARASVTKIVIEPGVVNIAKEAFRLFPNVKSVGYSGLSTDSTLSSIGEYAFAGLSHLKTVTLPNSVSSLSSHAFEGCSSLRSINIPKNLSSIGDHAFSRCYGLSQLYIPNNVTRIGEYAFSDCSNLSTVTFENPYTKGSPLWIGDYAFYGVNDATIAYTGVYELYDGESDIDAGTPVYTLSGKSLKWSPVHYTITTEAIGIGDVIVSDTHPAIGEKVDLTITPYGTYKTKVISVTDASGNYVNFNTVSDTSYNFRMPASDVTISVEFQRVYDIDVYATKYGTVKVADYTLAEGETARVTFVPDEGAYLDEYSVVSSGTRETIAEGKGSSVTFKMPAYDVEIYAWFKKKKYDITINSANNGTVTANASSAAEGSNVSLTVTPDEGYILSALYVRDEDGGLLPDALDYTFVMPDSDVTVTPVFEVKPVEYIDLTNAAVYVDTGSKTITVFVDNDDVPVGAYNVQYFPEGSDTPVGTDFPTEAGTYIAAVSAVEGSGYTGAARSEPFTVTKSADKTPRTTPSYIPDVVPEKETTPDTTPDITPSYIPNYIPAYIPTTTTTTVTTPAVDISKYSIKAQEDSDSFRLSWEAVPNAESYALYIQKDGNYLLVAELGKDTSAEIIEATNKTDFYVSTGGDYTKYKYDAKKGFTKAGTLAADKINTVKRANNVEEAFMVKYKISGVYSADRDSYKVSAKVYYKPAIKAVVSKDRARLSFAAVKDAEGYGLFRLNANGKLKLISETTKNAFIVNGLKYGKKYTYAVKALVNGSWTKVYKSDLVTVKAK